MIIGTGIDLVQVARIKNAVERWDDRFLSRIYTPQEISYCREKKRDYLHFAARFAAKEAVAKALGTGIGDVSWQEIEILRGPARQPNLHLSGRAAALADQLALYTWSLSLTHNQSQAIALVVAVGDR